MAGRAFTRRLAAAAAPLVSRPAAAALRTGRARHLLNRPGAAAAPRTAPARHLHTGPAAATHLSLTVTTPARHLLSRPVLRVKIPPPPPQSRRSFSTVTPHELDELKRKIKQEVLAELKADGILTEEQLARVKVIVHTEVLPVAEKSLSRHDELSEKFNAFKEHEIQTTSELKRMHTECLVRVGTVSWRVCIGVLSLTAFILFEFYDIVKVGWEAGVLQKVRDLVDQKMQEVEDHLTRRLKIILERELEYLCAKHFVKGQEAKSATNDQQSSGPKK